jgi:hypothetical protein
VHQNYLLDVLDFKLGGVDDDVKRFDRRAPDTPRSPEADEDRPQPAFSG